MDKPSLPVPVLAFGFLLSVLLFCAFALAGTPPRGANPATPASSPIESDGSLDPTFDAGNFTNATVLASLLQPDGKLLIGGSFSKVHGVTRLGIARLNADGSLDRLSMPVWATGSIPSGWMDSPCRVTAGFWFSARFLCAA